MELGTFLKPAVRSLLESDIVEVRLHLDGHTNLDRIKELQTELADGNLAMPYFVLVDPDSETRLAHTDASVALKEKPLLDFLTPGA